MLRQRILSALILGPTALAAAWLGGWFFVGLVGLAAVLLAWEWTRLCLGGSGWRSFHRSGLLLAVMAIAVAILGRLWPWSGLPLILAAAWAAPRWQAQAKTVSPPADDRPELLGRSPGWLIFGAFYIGLPVLSLVWLREQGDATLLWVLLLVWATDIGAYTAGRSIGGPRLLRRVSPNKTWAGLFGGIVAAALVGVATALILGPDGPSIGFLAALSALLALVEQAGDLGESWVKRHFGVKDSSRIIPGHGGVLDRLDGLLAVAPVVAALCLILGGGLAQWR